jgi:hypothetical protein
LCFVCVVSRWPEHVNCRTVAFGLTSELQPIIVRR